MKHMTENSESPSSDFTTGKCPFWHVAEAAQKFKANCHTIFGKPELEKQNLLGWLDGTLFADFIEDFAQRRVWNIDMVDPGKMKQLTLLGSKDMDMVHVLLQQFWFNTLWKQVSCLWYSLYSRFIKEHIGKVDKNDPINVLHFSIFTSTFIQAFDAVFITALRYAKTREVWDSMKKSMWRVLLHLAQIPTNIQEGITSSSERIGYMFWEDEPYMLEHIEKIYALQVQLWVGWIHGDSFEKIRAEGGYAPCPALADGVMKRSFNALHEVYGKVFFW
jgi:hypothetical protein